MRAMYTENSSKRLIFPLPISSDRQLGGLRSGEGRLRGTTGRAQETAAVFPDTHTVVLQSGGQHCWISQEASPGSPQVRKERNQPWSRGLPRPCYPYLVPHRLIWARNYRTQPPWAYRAALTGGLSEANSATLINSRHRHAHAAPSSHQGRP